MKKYLLVFMLVLTVCVWAGERCEKQGEMHLHGSNSKGGYIHMLKIESTNEMGYWRDGAKRFEVYVGDIGSSEKPDQIAYLGVETVVDSTRYREYYNTRNGLWWEDTTSRNRHYLNLRINGKDWRIALEEVE